LRQGGLEDILIYSGLTAPALLAAYPWVQSLSAALVAGPFDQNRPAREIYRGSANQELTLFDQALAPLYQTWAKQTQRQAQTLVAAGRLWLLGIPGLGDYERLVATTARLAAP
jgi:anaerobic ribonucleoside-triphosphate reductase activating protein